MSSPQSDVEFKPNAELLESLVGMGIPRRAGELALYYTGNGSADAAAAFYFDNPDLPDEEKAAAGEDDAEAPPSEDASPSRCKMVFVVNLALGMGLGKVAAQVAHASLGLYRNLVADGNVAEDLKEWEEFGEKKIVLKGENAEHLLGLYKVACDNKISCYLVQDAGHTQVEPGSITVLGLFGEENCVNMVSGTLKLL